MNGIAMAVPATNVYNSGTPAPELENLFSNCPEALKQATTVINLAQMSASAFKEELLGSYDTKVDDANTFNLETRTNRLAHVLFSTLYSYQGVQSKLIDYCTDSNPGILKSTYSTGASVVSTVFSPLTRLASWALSFVRDPAPDQINCDSNPTTLDREAYTFCNAAKAFFAETEVNKLKESCPTVVKANIEPVATKYIQSFGTFLAAAEERNLTLSFNPENARKDWDNRFKEVFCESNPNNVFCTDAAPKHPSSLKDWEATVFSDLSLRIPAEVVAEVQEALTLPIETNVATKEDL